MKIEKDTPECFQNSINKVIYFSTLLLYDQEDQVFGGLDITKMEDQLNQNLGTLLNHFEIEGFQNQYVKARIAEVQYCGNSKEDLKRIIRNICAAQIKHRFFNFKEFQQLQSLNEDSAKSLFQKDITLLLGSTGCGKSTTVHYLCGSKMIKTKKADLIHIEPSLIINKDLIKVKCSPISKSETRYVTPIEINLSQIGQTEDQIITLVDTPGSQDTESYEVDISNGLGIIQAVRQANSVRVAILFSYLKLGARVEELKKLISFYAGMFQNLQNNLPAFSFFFTHVPLNISISNLRALLEDGFKELTEQDKQNKNLVIMFDDIVNKAFDSEKGKSKQVHILRPLDGEPIEIHRSILQSSPIQDTSQFLEKLDDNGQFQVKEQFKIHAEGILSAIKRGEGQYAIYLLKDLINFQKIFSQDQVFENQIKIIVTDVNNIGQQLFRKGMQGLEKAFIVSENNNLTEKDLQTFEQSFIKAKQAIDPFYQEIQKSFFENENTSFKKLQSFQYIEELCKLLEKSLEEVISNRNQLQNHLWNRYINKYKLTLEYFNLKSQFMNSEENLLKYISQNIISELVEVFKSSIKVLEDKTMRILSNMTLDSCSILNENNKSPIELLTEIYAQLVAAFNQIEDKELKQSLDKSLKQIQDLIKGKWQEIRDSELKNILFIVGEIQKRNQQSVQQDIEDIIQVPPKDVQNITNFLIMHHKLSTSLELIPGIDSQFLEEQENQLINLQKQLIQFYNENEQQLKQFIRKEGNNHRNIKNAYNQIRSLREVPFIEKQTNQKFNDMIILLEELAEEKKNIVLKLIPDIDQLIQINGQQVRSSLPQLKDALKIIKELDYLLPQSKSFFLGIVDDLKSKLNTTADRLICEAGLLQLSFDEIKQFKKLQEIYKYINEIRQIAIDITGQEIKNIELTEIRKSVLELFTQIDQKVNNENHKILINKKDCSKLQQMFSFLKIMNQQKCPMIESFEQEEKSRQLQEDFKQFIQDNSKLQQQQFELNLQNLRQKCGLQNQMNQEEEVKIFEKAESHISIIEDQVIKAVKSICEILKTFKEFRTYYNELYLQFDEGMIVEDKMMDGLKYFLKDLKEKMGNMHSVNPTQFNINISILVNLFIIDSFISDKGNSFEQIHNNAYQIFVKEQGQSEHDADNALKNGDYEELNRIIQNEISIENLNNQSQFLMIIKKLQEHIRKLKDRILINMRDIMIMTQDYSLPNDILIDQLNQDVDLVKKLIKDVDNKKFIEQISFSDLQKTLIQFYKNLNNQSERIIQFSTILIRDQKYYEACKVIKETLNILNQISLDDNKEEQETVKVLVQDAKIKIIALNNQLQYLHKFIEEDVKSIKECSHPNDFKSMNVKLICRELLKFNQQNDYRNQKIYQYYDEINSSIKKKYLSRLEEIQKRVAVSFDDMNEIEDIEKSLSFVEDNIKTDLIEQIQTIRDNIRQQINSISQNLQDILSNQDVVKDILNLDFKNLSCQLKHRINNLQQEYKELVERQCLKMVEKIEVIIKEGSISDNFDTYLLKFYDIQSSFIQVHLKFETKKRIQELLQNISAIFNENQRIIRQYLQSLTIISQSEACIKNKELQIFQSFMKLPIEFHQNLNPKFQEQIISITNIGHKNLIEILSQFENNINNKNFKEAILIYKQIFTYEIVIKCLRDPNYLNICQLIQDPEINEKAEQFSRIYRLQIFHNKLLDSFNNNLEIAERIFEEIQNSNISKIDQFQRSIDILQIFAENSQFLDDTFQTNKVLSIQGGLKQLVLNKIDNSVKVYQQLLRNLIDQNFVKQFKTEQDTLKIMSNYFYSEAIEMHNEEQIKEILQFSFDNYSNIKNLLIDQNNTPNLNTVSHELIQLQVLIELFGGKVQKQFQQYQDKILKFVRNKCSLNPQNLMHLKQILEQSKYGQQIICQNQVLFLKEISVIQELNESDLQKLIEGVDLRQTQSQQNSINYEAIITNFKEFKTNFDQFINDFFQKKHDRDSLVYTLQAKISNKTEILAEQLPLLLALIFSIYAVENQSLEYKYPKPKHIIALFRMFGVGQNTSEFINNIIEMEQNEENSIVISIAASIFALYGYQVDCACANDFICMRELNKFSKLFQILKVQNLIKYKTLKKIFQNEIIFYTKSQNETDLKIQNAFQRKILKQDNSTRLITLKRRNIRKILLIYNIESLLSSKFQQEIFTPTIQIQNQQLSDLLKEASRCKLQDSILDAIKNFFHVNRLSNFNDQFHELIKAAIQKEIKNLNQKNIINSSGSQFQNIEGQRQKLILKIGKFVLSQIPLQYDFIMAVTSNLVLNSQQQKILDKKYKFVDLTVISTKIDSEKRQIFAQQKSQILSDQYQQFQFIHEKIKEIKQKDGVILVIFDSQKQQEAFENQIGAEVKTYQVLSYSLNGINEASQYSKLGELMAQVNLIERRYVVNVDFKIINSKFAKDQGLFVIQTFSNISETEQYNIYGIADQYLQIISQEFFDQNNQNQFSQQEVVDPQIMHENSIKFKEYVNKFNGPTLDNSMDSNLQKFLIELNKLN